MKKLIPAIIAAALLSGCATQNDAVALSNRISDQQKQINALSVRLQSAEHRLSQQESASRPETFDKLFMASVRASVALREPANISLRRSGFWSSSSGK